MVTEIDADFDGDTRFPAWDREASSAKWAAQRTHDSRRKAGAYRPACTTARNEPEERGACRKLRALAINGRRELTRIGRHAALPELSDAAPSRPVEFYRIRPFGGDFKAATQSTASAKMRRAGAGAAGAWPTADKAAG